MEDTNLVYREEEGMWELHDPNTNKSYWIKINMELSHVRDYN